DDPDVMNQHSAIYALIEIADWKTTSLGLTGTADQARLAMTALDQMKDGNLQAKDVVGKLNHKDPRLRETAWWIASRHPEWADQLGRALFERLAKPQSDEKRGDLVGQLAKLARAPAIQTLLADALRDAKSPVDSRRIVLAAMGEAALKDTPASWF